MDESGSSVARASVAGAVRATVSGPVPAARLLARSHGGSDRVPLLAWLIAGVFVAVELAFSARYGFMQDELYFIAAGHHLAFGYSTVKQENWSAGSHCS